MQNKYATTAQKQQNVVRAAERAVSKAGTDVKKRLNALHRLHRAQELYAELTSTEYTRR